MARSTYAIRNGFEYQDLYCAYQLLSYILINNLDVPFDIESDAALHVDDLVIRPSSDAIDGHQVKYHQTQEHVESFESLTAKATSKSKSLFQKLYAGWQRLTQTGCKSCRVTFISSNPAERGRYKLAPVIDNRTGVFSDKFFSHADYAKWRAELASHLKIGSDELRVFLESVTWRFSYESIDGLRRLVAHSLRQLGLPYDDDAVARLMEIVGHIATTPTGEQPITAFIQELWKSSRFRDSCEQRFPSIEYGAGQMRRANRLRVASVSIEVIPAFGSSRCSCLEEPFPWGDYRRAITATDKEALLDDQRIAWKQEYLAWLNSRIDAILATADTCNIDVLVFPRLSLPLEVAARVALWGKEHHVHCIVGGHSLATSSMLQSLYETDLNASIESVTANGGTLTDVVVDPLLRHDRAGRVSASQFESPFSRNESVREPTESSQLLGADGWVSAVVLPSKDIASDFLNRAPARPELILVSTGVHATELCDLLMAHPTLSGCALIVCAQDIRIMPSACVVEAGGMVVRHTDAWEGIVLHDIEYDRSAVSGWVAGVSENDRIPLVYKMPQSSHDGASDLGFRGSHTCREEAARRISTKQEPTRIEVDAEEPATFFHRRASEAKDAIRNSLAKASPDQIAALSETLKGVQAALEQYRTRAELPHSFTPSPPRAIPVRSSRFHNRAKEKEAIARFLQGTTAKYLLFLFGQPGIGKKELLAEVQRLSPDRDRWIRFRCSPDARLTELFSQFLVRLGKGGGTISSLDQAFYESFFEEIERRGHSVIVLEEGHNLPIFEDHPDHTALLEFLSYICSDRFNRRVRVIILSDRRGRLQFSGSHMMEPIRVEGMEPEYIVEMLQEYLVANASRFAPPTVDDLASIASRLHGHPYLTKLASVVLEASPASEVIEKLYSRIETREFVLGRLLGRMKLTEQEQQLLEFASMLRVPVTSEAFVKMGGPTTQSLLEELLNRFLLVSDDKLIRLHPVVTEFFADGLTNAEHVRQLQAHAFAYFDGISQRRELTVDERVEYVYYGVSCGKSIDLRDMQAFAGSVRSALTEGVHNRDWLAVENAAKQLLSVWPYESMGQIGMALALEGTGREHETEQYLGSLEHVTQDSLWLAIEFVRSRIRRRDYDGAERTLATIVQRFSDSSEVLLAEAQLYERRGETDKAVEVCERVLASQGVKEFEAFMAGLILRDANRLDVLVKHVEANYEDGLRNDGLLRLYGLACVVTNYDPQEGLEILSQLWDAAPSDGFVVADYAIALRALGRTVDARAVLARGLAEVPRRAKGRRALLEAEAEALENDGRLNEAFAIHRELVGNWQNYLHLHRRFASCLLSAAAQFRTDGESAREDSAVNEAISVLKRLLQIAPLDKWAADALHRGEMRSY